MDRPSWDEYFMEMAELTAKRSSLHAQACGCSHRKRQEGYSYRI